jgi:hypothetical protein
MPTAVLAVLIAAAIVVVIAGLTWMAGALLDRWLGEDDEDPDR